MLRIPFHKKRVSRPRETSLVAISRRSRLLAALLGIGLLTALLLASRLTPDARGWGTHEQLGLPRCTLLAATGLRCPACGMTTSWSYVTHGQWANAFKTHVAGTLLAPVAAVVSLAAMALAARGKAWRVNENVVVGVVVAATGLIVCEWIVRVMVG
jgi:hypothetical protein